MRPVALAAHGSQLPDLMRRAFGDRPLPPAQLDGQDRELRQMRALRLRWLASVLCEMLPTPLAVAVGIPDC